MDDIWNIIAYDLLQSKQSIELLILSSLTLQDNKFVLSCTALVENLTNYSESDWSK